MNIMEALAKTRPSRGNEHRTERVDLRMTPRQKRAIQAAASYEGTNLTSFILRLALHEAEEIMRRAERLELSARDGQRVLELLENPPVPTPALRKAVADKYGD
jgi:uncharacterized protein (DUF1778 family)